MWYTVSKQQIWSIKFACYANFGRLVHGCYFDGQTIIYTCLLAGIFKAVARETNHNPAVFSRKRFCRFRKSKVYIIVNIHILFVWETLLTVSRYTQYLYRDGHWHAILQQNLLGISQTLQITKRAADNFLWFLK